MNTVIIRAEVYASVEDFLDLDLNLVLQFLFVHLRVFA
jgi:hypothetical protein